ncbi:MAG: hypothetical protein U5K51_02330 [Flavobacteriaceae bacterium]|nr:hypothetical protein [Flavobacteriaceae bacterium]
MSPEIPDYSDDDRIDVFINLPKKSEEENVVLSPPRWVLDKKQESGARTSGYYKL